MILFIVGVKEGVEIAEALAAKGHQLQIVAKTRASRDRISQSTCGEYLLGNGEISKLMKTNDFSKFRWIVDADSVSNNEFQNIISCLENRPRYIRYLREELDLTAGPLIKTAYSFEEAAEIVEGKEYNTIFLTTGSYNLETFLNNEKLQGKRIIARILPNWRVIKKCQDLGLASRDIIAMQGPFSIRINKEIYRMCKADVIVTRDSGKTGGTDNKIVAALELNIPIVVIKRRKTNNFTTANCLQDILSFLEEDC